MTDTMHELKREREGGREGEGEGEREEEGGGGRDAQETSYALKAEPTQEAH